MTTVFHFMDVDWPLGILHSRGLLAGGHTFPDPGLSFHFCHDDYLVSRNSPKDEQYAVAYPALNGHLFPLVYRNGYLLL